MTGVREGGNASELKPRGAIAESRDATEDFLFHLYRGNELLQDNRIHEAKEELEHALRLQPRDAKGQDLLAVVYFRLGLYPRAIEIYEELSRAHPGETPLALNLALCYLKTGQPAPARTLLENLVAAQPEHLRAWSYLGLVHERLGDYDKARTAFAHAQQPGMVRRMEDLIAQAAPPDEPAASSTAPPSEPAASSTAPPSEPAAPSTAPPDEPAAPRSARPETFEELDTEITMVGMPAIPRITVAPPALAAEHEAAGGPPFLSLAIDNSAALSSAPTDPPRAASLAAAASGLALPTLATLTTRARLTFPNDPGAVAHPSGLLLCRVQTSFAVRASAVAQFTPGLHGFKTTGLARRMRNRPLDEPLGGERDPLLAIVGHGGLALVAAEGHSLLAFRLEDDILFVRETSLVAFDTALVYENGRLAAFAGEAVALVQLKGRGSVVLRAPGSLVTTEVAPDHPAICPRNAVLGWAGRLLPRELSPDEAPFGVEGLVAFAGEGTVLASSGVSIKTM